MTDQVLASKTWIELWAPSFNLTQPWLLQERRGWTSECLSLCLYWLLCVYALSKIYIHTYNFLIKETWINFLGLRLYGEEGWDSKPRGVSFWKHTHTKGELNIRKLNYEHEASTSTVQSHQTNRKKKIKNLSNARSLDFDLCLKGVFRGKRLRGLAEAGRVGR